MSECRMSGGRASGGRAHGDPAGEGPTSGGWANRAPANETPASGRTTSRTPASGRTASGSPELPTLIPGPLAAHEAGVAPATIRKWVQLGHLKAAGKAGRAQLFRLEDVFAAERAARGTARGGKAGRR